MFGAPSRSTLLVFLAEGCPSCEKARPEIDKYKRRNPLQMVLVLDADGPFAAQFDLAPIRETPLYVVKMADRGVKHVGWMKAEAMERWAKIATATMEEE
jgi:hypothetical protein